MRIDPRQAALNVKMLILDVDGVLTDGGLYYDNSGQVMKRFNVQDGLGVKLAQSVDLEIAVATGLDSKAVKRRVKELDIEEYFAGRLDKAEVVRDIAARRSIDPSEMAYLGDDWVDAGALRLVGLPMAVTNAQPEILKLAAWTSTVPGGHGAVREAITFILDAQSKLDRLWRKWS
ncbi:MAG: phenylphosphate carboxylase subunit delta [Desulfovibrio sp.]|nr:MAG: phenylphosphate carboxylase subunit delta [Desulfovibrio sp.]